MKALLLAGLLLAAVPAGARPLKASDLSLEELAGQVFMIAVDTEIASAREADIRAGRVGGGILRWDKFTGPEASSFTARMREWSESTPHRIPFWVATDHEGGATFTMRRYGVTPFPGNMALGATGSEELTRSAARATARELRALGIHVTFAPAVDANSNPANPIIGARSFGEDPALVARLGRAAVRGYAEGGLLAVVKHFPGHGDTSDDSHLGLPVSTKSLSSLEAVELVPFRAAVRAGAEGVMPAHMVFPALGTGPTTPVTLSSAALDGFLRRSLGFKGLVFSDSLDMGAIANVRGSSEAALGALEAGADVLLLGKAEFPPAYDALIAAVKSGRVSRARLERSVDLILAAKRRHGLFGAGAPAPVPPARLAEHAAAARAAAEGAVTVVRDSGLLPLRPGAPLGVVLLRSPRFDEEAAFFLDEVRRRAPGAVVVDVPRPSTAALQSAEAAVAASPILLLGTSQSGVPVPPATAEFIRRMASGSRPTVVLSLMNPYDLSLSTGAGAAVACYGMTRSALAAAARVLFGEIPAKGRLPVSVPGAASRR